MTQNITLPHWLSIPMKKNNIYTSKELELSLKNCESEIFKWEVKINVGITK